MMSFPVWSHVLSGGGGSLSRGSLSRGGLCPGVISVQRGVSVQRGISVQGVSVQGGLCPEGRHPGLTSNGGTAAAVGMYPTGMHSCLKLFSVLTDFF